MPTTVVASSEQVANVLKVLQRSMPRGAMYEQIERETGYSNNIIWSAIHSLEREAKIESRSPFAYDAKALDTDDSDPGGKIGPAV